MQQAQQGSLQPFDAHTWHVGLVVAQFNRHITNQLKVSALKRAVEYQLAADKIATFEVAGAVEIPLVLARLAASGHYQALLAIGCVIRGETPHFDYVCKFVSEGILRVQLDHNLPIGFGVLTCENEAQALARTNLGADHLDATLHQARLLQTI